MCTGMEIAAAASLASTLGGTYMQMQAQEKAQDRINNVISSNAEKNDQLQRDSQASMYEALGGYNKDKLEETQTQQTDDIRTRLVNSLSKGNLPGDYSTGPVSENTQKYIKDTSTKASKFSEDLAKALAEMKGFDSTLTTLGRGTTKAAEKAGMNKSFQAGNTAILPAQIEAAKASGHSPIGDALTMAGSIGQAITLPATAGSFFNFGSPTDITAKTAGSVGSKMGGKAIDLSSGFRLA